MGVEVKTLNAVALIKKLRERKKLAKNDGEFDDLVYEEHQGKKEAAAMGCMVGRTKYE